MLINQGILQNQLLLNEKDMSWKFKDKILFSIVGFLGAAVIYLLGKTVRIKAINIQHHENIKESGKQVIFAFWHNTLFYFAYFFRGKQIYTLSSKSRDGEYMVRSLRNLGYNSVRGSSSKGAAKSLVEIKFKLDNGYDVGFTPDGPRGPIYSTKPGIIWTAKASGQPILPMTCDFKRKWVLKSWDKFIIPKPFSKGIIYFGEPIIIPKDTTKEDFAKYEIILKEKLDYLRDRTAEFIENMD